MLFRMTTALLCMSLCAAWDTQGFLWSGQWHAEEYYLMPNDKMRASFEGEYYTPVSVGGKAAVQIWMNKFTDMDCGNADTNSPYLETWTSIWVTPKDEPLELNYTRDMSLLVADPNALIWMHRVILGDAFGIDTSANDPALGALLGGHNMWGFPKHPKKAKFQFEYEGTDRVDFHALPVRKNLISDTETYVDSLTVSVQLSEKSEGNIPVPVNVRTAGDGVVGGPSYMVQQTRFGEAFIVTQNITPWSSNTDSIELGTDDYGSSVLKAWKCDPKLKMHTADFQIVAIKPSNWLGAGAKPSPLAISV